MNDTKINREFVQAGLDLRAKERQEAAQEEQDALFLDELNKLTEASRNMTARLEAAQRRVKAQKREQRREQETAARRDSFMQQIFTTLLTIAAAILLHNIGAVAFWLTATIGICGLLYIIAKSVEYYTHDKRKEK